MNIIICDDEILYQSAIQQAIKCWSKESKHADIHISVFHSSEDLLEYFNKGSKADLLFLDIEIPHEISGLQLAYKIRELSSDISIVFVTNYDEYVYEGYAVNALRFLRKPVLNDDIYFCCSYVYNRLSLNRTNSIALYSGNIRMTLRYLEILYIEAHSHTLYVFTTTQNSPIKISTRLVDIIKILPEKLFVFCHRSYIVNIAHIRLLTRTKICLSHGLEIPVSRTYVDTLNYSFDSYFRGGILKNGLDNV